ncbi:serine hydrolase domain-containing protein [Psychroserpens luteolus]|uniref:serine hydrolase domain-containing protein n=1 Tax=Psychroserpens luteolus TaxID=2855840 RepID=UPI001E488DD9|nr:serine hydrolase domain-containing protein [Psychroserpens luteolus]MCD2259163.1 beta-lactamase family protein [Psychroserpens luteolus]
MKTLLKILVVLCITTTLNAQDITGKWYGLLEIPGNSLRIHLTINKSADNYSAIMMSPDQSNQEIPVSSLSFENPKLTVEVTDLQVIYNGELKGKEINGTFTQNGNSLPLTFKRTEKVKEKPTTLEGQIDEIFASWDNPKSAGGAVGVMKNGEVIYSKAFGAASLEYNIPNSPETLFNIGSVSKQFTAMGIVLLHEQGKLSVDDDIRKYLTDLPDFGHKITIRHLLHHTSGLRSLHALFGIAGWRDDDSKTNADLRRVMKYQTDLNFKPGDEYLYCNTGYMFMADIIEEVTGEKFSDWMKKSVFDPLGMTNSYAEDKYNRIVPNNATSYNYNGEAFVRAVEYWGYVGSGNVHSNTNELLSWLSNFYAPKEGWESAFKMLETLDTFNNGKPNNYAFGVVIDDFNGKKRIQHNGAVGGFRASASSFPEEKLNIVILSNFSSSNIGGKNNALSQLFIEANNQTNEFKSKLPEAIEYNSKELKKYEGQFWNNKESYARKIYIKNDTLMYQRAPGNENKLVPIGKSKFKMLDVQVDLVTEFVFNNNTLKEMLVLIDDDAPIIMEAFSPVSPSSIDKKAYVGTYYSPELETQYRFYLENDDLKWRHIRHGEFPVEFIGKNILQMVPGVVIKVKRNSKDKIEGFYVTNGRVRHLWFEKEN